MANGDEKILLGRLLGMLESVKEVLGNGAPGLIRGHYDIANTVSRHDERIAVLEGKSKAKGKKAEIRYGASTKAVADAISSWVTWLVAALLAGGLIAGERLWEFLV